MAINTKEIKWEKLKRSSSSYQPSKRSGCSMALWAAKAQGILFGGVSDTDKDEERMDSVFYNDMYSPKAPTFKGLTIDHFFKVWVSDLWKGEVGEYDIEEKEELRQKRENTEP